MTASKDVNRVVAWQDDEQRQIDGALDVAQMLAAPTLDEVIREIDRCIATEATSIWDFSTHTPDVDEKDAIKRVRALDTARMFLRTLERSSTLCLMPDSRGRYQMRCEFKTREVYGGHRQCKRAAKSGLRFCPVHEGR